MSGIALPSDSLCPGYTRVDEFAADEEYEDEEEVEFVTLDLGNIEPTLLSSTEYIRLIGLDTPTPYLQLSGTIFKGSHDLLLGSELLFTEKKDEHDRSKRHLSYVGSTSQRIRFKEVQLKPKLDGSEEQTEKDGGSPADEQVPPSGYAHGLDCVTGKEAPQKKTRRRGPKPKEKEEEANDGRDNGAEKPKKKERKRRGKKGTDDANGEDEDDGAAAKEKPRRKSQRSAKKRKRPDSDDGGDVGDGGDGPNGGQAEAAES
ncbi:hypothetical protein VNI00_006992 [Paramarasmius palmivorus]|uniref:Transcription factor TFIIIC triple barrel domain-containing protein n=1 Tax=Paramarasmius palmivorus TaxID=297713 RepID=A0AAW0D0M1_9AGAR